MYIINPDGLFITHEDINAVMEKDFFNQISVSVSQVNEMSLENNRHFDELEQETKKFNDSAGG